MCIRDRRLSVQTSWRLFRLPSTGYIPNITPAAATPSTSPPARPTTRNSSKGATFLRTSARWWMRSSIPKYGAPALWSPWQPNFATAPPPPATVSPSGAARPWPVSYTHLNAATNVAFPFTTVSTAIALMMGIGTAANFNLNLGAGNEERARRVAGTGLSCLCLLYTSRCV